MQNKGGGWSYCVNDDFDIKHIKGKENKVVDVLSRKMHVAAISTSTSYLKDKIIEARVTNELYQ